MFRRPDSAYNDTTFANEYLCEMYAMLNFTNICQISICFYNAYD